MDRIARLCFALFLVGILASCGGDDDDVLTPEVETAVAELGSAASAALVEVLMTQLSGAMQVGGPANAIDFCSTSAVELTAGVVRQQGLDIKRTSLRYRNPGNAPDEAETEALRHFQSVLAETGEMPGHWVQKAARDEYRYYRPLLVAAPCLSCHGSAGEIEPAVQATLDERYPDDLATGSQVGDFRGVIRVSVPADRIEPGSG